MRVSSGELICHVTSVHPLDDVRIVRKEVRSLVQHGFDVAVVGTEGRVATDVGARFVTVAKRYHGRVSRMTMHTGRVVREALRLDAKVYHLHDPELLPWVPVLKRSGARVVYDAHEDLRAQTVSKHYLPAGFRKPVASAVGGVERALVRMADAIVAATPAIAERFSGQHTVVVRNFPLREEWERLPVREEGRTARWSAVYAGTLACTRGILELVEALQLATHDVRLLLLGDFADPQFQEVCRRSPGWANVEHLGWQARAGVIRAYSSAKVGLVTLHPTPAYVVSLPVKLFEYMAAGLPVIASDFPAWRELLNGIGCALFVDPEDPREIAAAIDWIVEHPAEAEEMGRRGRRAVEERFNWETESRKLIALYERLLGT